MKKMNENHNTYVLAVLQKQDDGSTIERNYIVTATCREDAVRNLEVELLKENRDTNFKRVGVVVTDELLNLECKTCGCHSLIDGVTKVFPNIDNLIARIQPGGAVPDAECPNCGALMYRVNTIKAKHHWFQKHPDLPFSKSWTRNYRYRARHDYRTPEASRGRQWTIEEDKLVVARGADLRPKWAELARSLKRSYKSVEHRWHTLRTQKSHAVSYLMQTPVEKDKFLAGEAVNA